MSLYYSQFNQDKFINLVFFRNKKNGFFIDIGAHDGVTFSNTYFFEKKLNWNGVCIEPIPEVYEQLSKNRKSKLINACISDKDETVIFTRVKGYGEMLSGIRSALDEKQIQRIKESVSKQGCTVEEIHVNAISFNTLLKNEKIITIDLINIDTEGSEWNIIKSIPFNDVTPSILLVENNYGDKKVRKYLEDHGYHFIIHLGDDIFYYKKPSYFQKAIVLLFRIKRSLKFRYNKLFKRIGKN